MKRHQFTVHSKASVVIVLAALLWLSVVTGGMVLMTRYAGSVGKAPPAPEFWPKGSQIPFGTQRPTLLMFVHPRCPCSRASLGELDRLLGQVKTPPNVQVVFLKPAGTSSNWEKTDLWQTASSIPGVIVRTDDGGLEATRFHAETSGFTLLYGPEGKLKFQGGITIARGHAGDNPGRTAVRELLQEGRASQTKTPVFGCQLSERQCRQGIALCKP